MAKIIIKRKKSMLAAAQNHDVYYVNSHIGKLKNGGTLECFAEVGTHILTFKSDLGKLGKDATFAVVINEENEVVELNTGFAMNGEYEVKYADNRPHISTAAEPVQAPVTEAKAMPAEQTGGVRCVRCGSANLTTVSEVSTQGKDFKAGDACCGAVLLGPLGLLCGATGKGKQTTTTTYWVCKNCGNKFKV